MGDLPKEFPKLKVTTLDLKLQTGPTASFTLKGNVRAGDLDYSFDSEIKFNRITVKIAGTTFAVELGKSKLSVPSLPPPPDPKQIAGPAEPDSGPPKPPPDPPPPQKPEDKTYSVLSLDGSFSFGKVIDVLTPSKEGADAGWRQYSGNALVLDHFGITVKPKPKFELTVYSNITLNVGEWLSISAIRASLTIAPKDFSIAGFRNADLTPGLDGAAIALNISPSSSRRGCLSAGPISCSPTKAGCWSAVAACAADSPSASGLRGRTRAISWSPSAATPRWFPPRRITPRWTASESAGSPRRTKTF